MLKNTSSCYGKIAIALHWLSTTIVIGQFILGLYMLSLDYYDSYYKLLPYYHKSIGILFALLLLGQILWRVSNPSPKAVEGVKHWEHRLAHWGKIIMLGLMIIIVLLGYLISTSDGASVSVFGWFSIPATLTMANQEEWAGVWHHYLSVTLIVFASIHALAALKHHFINNDKTLLRMLGH